MENVKRRNSSLDILRILSMVFIIVLHFQGKTGYLNSSTEFSLLWFEKNIVEAFCICAVNCYVLISGYYLVDSVFSWKKCFRLWIKVLVISLIFCILTVFILNDFSLKRVFISLFPVNTKEYWFITVYIGMYLLSPFLNILLNNISKQTHCLFAVLMVTMFSVLPSIIPYGYLDGIGFDGISGTNITWFLTLYVTAAYVKRYVSVSRLYSKRYWFLLGYIVSGILIFSAKLIFSFLGQRIDFLQNLITHYYNYGSVFSFTSSFFLFLFFLGRSYNENICGKFAGFWGKRTFGIYLIHENDFSRYVLWGVVAKAFERYMNGITYIPIMLIMVMAVFLVCGAMDYLFEGAFSTLFDFLAGKMESVMNKMKIRILTMIDIEEDNHHA